MARKVSYKGELSEVVFLLTGKVFQFGKPTEVTEEEYQALKEHPDFVRFKDDNKSKKEGAK